MEQITIQITDTEYQRLQTLASEYGLSVSELARLNLEDLLATPDDETREAVDYILDKNKELYRRLAK